MIRFVSLIAAMLFAAGTLAAQEWIVLSSGTGVTLNDVQFVDEANGFVVGAGGTVLKSTNGGSTWEDVSPPGVTGTLNALHFLDAQTGLVAGERGVMRRTTDGGATWSTVDSAVRDELLALSFAGDVGICGGRALDILGSTDAGVSWEFVDGGSFCGAHYGAFQLDALTAYVVGDNCVFQPLVQWTSDGGSSWNFAVFYLNGNEGTLRDVFFHDVDNGFVVSNSWSGEGGISRTVDGGTSWATTLYPDELYGLDFPTVGTGYAVGGNGSVLRTTDGGSSWGSEQSGASAWLYATDFVNEGTGYAVGESGTILKREGSTGGLVCGDIETFKATCKPDRSLHARVLILNSTIHAGDEVVFGVNGEGHPAVIETNGTHSKAVLFLANMEPGLYIVTLEEPAGCFEPIAVFCDSTQSNLTDPWEDAWPIDVPEELETSLIELPEKTTLIGNYPNPFNPSTTITYGTSKDSRVTLNIYNSLGQHVATLVDELQTAGVRSVRWEGTDKSGRTVAGGVYHYLLRAGEVAASGKMLLVK